MSRKIGPKCAYLRFLMYKIINATFIDTKIDHSDLATKNKGNLFVKVSRH